MKLKQKDLKEYRNSVLKTQGFVCSICGIKLTKDTACLDHDHSSGDCRGVLCRNCNQMEGKIRTCSFRAKRTRTPIEWLESLIAYLRYHEEHRSGVIHPLHKTDEDKRLLRNKRARIKRKAT